MIRRATVTVTGATGGAGTATANARSGAIVGIIRAVYLAYVDSPPAGTTDITIEGVTSPAVAILTVSNAATDGWFYPMGQAVNTSAATITNQGAPIAMDGQVKVTIAQANNGDGVTATILYEHTVLGT